MANSNKHPILVVDDEPEILHSLRGLLRMEFQVHTAETGTEALAILHRQPVHVVMTDQRMPEMTGVELLNRVHGECPLAVRIVFTGYADIKAVIDAINQGHIYRYITKPWDPDELRSVLHQACEHYDQLVERQRLLKDLRGYLDQCLPHLDGQGSGADLAGTGKTLCERLERALQREEHS